MPLQTGASVKEAQIKGRGNSMELTSAAHWRDSICRVFPGLTLDWLEDGSKRARLFGGEAHHGLPHAARAAAFFDLCTT
jgi:hypothetical protein